LFTAKPPIRADHELADLAAAVNDGHLKRLALAPEMAKRGAFVTLPENWHTLLRQTMLLVKGAGPIARAFAEFLRGPQAREILARNGFGLPTS
jgi:hypothetical protein